MNRTIKANRAALTAVQFLVVLAAACTTVFIMKDRYWAGSVDLADHYDLATGIARTWIWPSLAPDQVSGVKTYPPLAHYLGALLSLPFGNVLIGMNVAVILSIFGCYLLLGRAISAGSLLGTLVSCALATAALFFLRSQGAAEGYEVFGSFFYAQMVGEFAFLLFVTWLCASRLDWVVRLAIAAAVIFVSTWLYLIASVEMALAFVALEAVGLWRRIMAERALRPSWVAPLVSASIILPAVNMASPMFKLMMTIAGNNGGIVLGQLIGLVPALAAVLLTVSILLACIPEASARLRFGLLLPIAGCATATACLVQAAALWLLHIGSPYAVDKYGFSVSTLLAFNLALGAAVLMDSRRPHRSCTMVALAFPPLFAVAVTTYLPPNRSPARLDALARYVRFTRQVMREPSMPADMMGATVSRNPAFHWTLNYAVSRVDFGMPASKALPAALQQSAGPDDPATYEFRADPADGIPERCILSRQRFDQVFLARTHCPYYPLIAKDAVISLAELKAKPRYLDNGWSGLEPSGVWSDGDRASLMIHIADAPARVILTFNGAAFIPAPGYAQHVLLGVSGREVGRWTFDDAGPAGDRAVTIPRELLSNGDLKLDFTFPDATSPADHKLSGDARKLAYQVQGITLGDPNRPLKIGDATQVTPGTARTIHFGPGWSGQEATGRWSLGKRAILSLYVKAEQLPVVNISVDANAFIPHAGYVQHVFVTSGAHRLAEWTYDDKSASGARVVSVPRELVKSDGEIVLEFDLPDATSPAENKLSGDSRQISIFVKSLSFLR